MSGPLGSDAEGGRCEATLVHTRIFTVQAALPSNRLAGRVSAVGRGLVLIMTVIVKLRFTTCMLVYASLND